MEKDKENQKEKERKSRRRRRRFQTGEAAAGIKKAGAGETLAEVMAGAAIFLLFVALFQSAVFFCTAAQKKSREIRADASVICRKLQSAPADGADAETYAFCATSADGAEVGNQVFAVTALRQERKVEYAAADGTEKTMVFYVYGRSGAFGGGEGGS